MSEFIGDKIINKSNFHKLLQERIDKENPRREMTAEEAKRLNKLEIISDKLKRG